jgi:hypothetical protein
LKPPEGVAFGDKNYPNCDTSSSFFRPSEAALFYQQRFLTSSAAKPDDRNIGDAFYVTVVDKKKQIGLARLSLTRRLRCRARDKI